MVQTGVDAKKMAARRRVIDAMLAALVDRVPPAMADDLVVRARAVLEAEFNVAPSGLDPLDEAMCTLANKRWKTPYRPGMADYMRRLAENDPDLKAFYADIPDWQKVAFFGRVMVFPCVTWEEIFKAAWHGSGRISNAEPLLADAPPTPGLLQQWCMADAKFIQCSDKMLRTVQAHERDAALASSIMDVGAHSGTDVGQNRAREATALSRVTPAKQKRVKPQLAPAADMTNF